MHRLRTPSPAFVVSLIALFVALGGTAYAATSLPANSVGPVQLKANAVTSPKIKNLAVTAAKIDTNGLTVPNALHATTADSATNATTANKANTLPALSFTTLTLQNGWTGAPFGTRTPAVALDAQKVVHLEGAVSQTGTYNAVVFTLPAADRPSAHVYLDVDMCNAKSGRLSIDGASGQVEIQVGGSSAASDAQCFTSLEGVTFPAG
jgi:hypothetical protein